MNVSFRSLPILSACSTSFQLQEGLRHQMNNWLAYLVPQRKGLWSYIWQSLCAAHCHHSYVLLRLRSHNECHVFFLIFATQSIQVLFAHILPGHGSSSQIAIVFHMWALSLFLIWTHIICITHSRSTRPNAEFCFGCESKSRSLVKVCVFFLHTELHF